MPFPSIFARSAFTLVEMLVVIAIIALLLAALLPAFSSVKNQAKLTQAAAQFRSLDTGIRTFQADSALGGALPPSSSDRTNPLTDRQKIANPLNPTENPPIIRVAGAHLLVHAMIGADGLGTPGFRDVSRPADGLWSNDTHRNPQQGNEGLYFIDDDGKEKFPRYGGAGYVDEKMKESTKSLQELSEAGKILNLDRQPADIAKNERTFVDPWDHPILYYRANPSSLRMTGDGSSPPKPGIYWQEDNAVITGNINGLFSDELGLDFGQGADNGTFHDLANARSPDSAVQLNDFLADTQFERSFARYILDPGVKARLTPVQKDSYLLISAGLDARYGTADDVTNWTKTTN